MTESKWNVARIFLAMVFCIVLMRPANAADVFEIKDVYVDVTAENVTEARKQAMREGQARAFDLMLKRLTLKKDRDLLPWVEPNNRAQYIRDFSVADEKTSAVRYLAKLSFHFKEEAIRNLLKGRGIPFAETISKPVLVIPLYKDGTRLTIWDEPNPWSAAWSKRPTDNGLVPIALPLGDLADISGLSAQQALDSDRAALLNMANRYGVNSAVVAQLVVAGRNENDQPKDVDLIVTRVGGENEGRSTSLGLRVQEGERTQDFLKRVTEVVSQDIEEEWKKQNLLQFGLSNVLPVNLSIANLQEWLNVKKRLANVAVVRRVELALLSKDTVQLNLHFIGNLDQLIGSLRQVDLDLTLEHESWSLVNLGQGRPS